MSSKVAIDSNRGIITITVDDKDSLLNVTNDDLNIPKQVKDYIKECKGNRISLAKALVGAPADKQAVWQFLDPNHATESEHYEDNIDYNRANIFALAWFVI